MVDDEQTHRLPQADADRRRVAALSGQGQLRRFDAAVGKVLKIVNKRYGDLFAGEEALSSKFGSLVFTGVEDDPETLATLARMGFSRPERISAAIRGWHHGRIAATRTERGREALHAPGAPVAGRDRRPAARRTSPSRASPSSSPVSPWACRCNRCSWPSRAFWSWWCGSWPSRPASRAPWPAARRRWTPCWIAISSARSRRPPICRRPSPAPAISRRPWTRPDGAMATWRFASPSRCWAASPAPRPPDGPSPTSPTG